MAAPDATDRPRQLRVLRLAIGLLAIEAALVVLGYMAPAMHDLIRPVYIVVVLVFAGAILHGARRRNRERRQEQRRHPEG